MQPVTVILLNKGNNLDNTLESIVSLQPQQILLGTFIPINIKFKEITIIDFKNINYNESLNELQILAQTDWIFYLKDNENLLQFNEYMPNLLTKTKEIYGLQVLQDDVIIKESRLWNKKEQKVNFKNPIFEKPNIEPTKIIDVILYQHKTHDPRIAQTLEFWKKSAPLSTDAAYYKAFDELAKKNFIEFKRIIVHYLFNIRHTDIPSTIARYYLALVQGIIENNTNEAIQNIIACLAENPLMAEFWCLLGDIFAKMEKFDDAISFYENAIILGGRRPKLDFWPMHISRYGDYPKEMIDKCKKVLNSAETYQSNHI